MNTSKSECIDPTVIAEDALDTLYPPSTPELLLTVILSPSTFVSIIPFLSSVIPVLTNPPSVNTSKSECIDPTVIAEGAASGLIILAPTGSVKIPPDAIKSSTVWNSGLFGSMFVWTNKSPL